MYQVIMQTLHKGSIISFFQSYPIIVTGIIYQSIYFTKLLYDVSYYRLQLTYCC